MTFFKKNRTLYRLQQFVTYLSVMPVLILGSSLTLIAQRPANSGDETIDDVVNKINRVVQDLTKQAKYYADEAKIPQHDKTNIKLFKKMAERYTKDQKTLHLFGRILEDGCCRVTEQERRMALDVLERYKQEVIDRIKGREKDLIKLKERLAERTKFQEEGPRFRGGRLSFNDRQIRHLKNAIDVGTQMHDYQRRYLEWINQLIKQINEIFKNCGYSASTATAVAEVILPKGTPTVTVPIPTDSVIRFHEDATVLVSTDNATASVDDPPQITPRRVKPGDEIPGNEIVTVLLDSGTGFITPHTPITPEVCVHTGRDTIIHEPADPLPTTTPTDPTNQKDPETDPETDPPPPVTLHDGALVLSILSRVPFTETKIGTSKWSKSATDCHFDVLVDGKKHGEVVTYTGLQEKDFENEPVQVSTCDENGDTIDEWETESHAVDGAIQIDFNRGRYQLGESGLLLISGQDSLLQAEGKRRIGHPSRPSDWKLALSTSANVAGPPTQLPFTTHSVPFTVAGPGQLQATVTASLNQPPEDFPYVVDVPLPPGSIPANLLTLLQQYFSPPGEEINDEQEDATNDEPASATNDEPGGDVTKTKKLPEVTTPRDYYSGPSAINTTVKNNLPSVHSTSSVPPRHLTVEEKIRWHESWIQHLTTRYTQIVNGCHDTVRILTTAIDRLETEIKDMKNKRYDALQTYVDDSQATNTFSVKDYAIIRKRFEKKIQELTEERDKAKRALPQAESNASHVKDLINPSDHGNGFFFEGMIKEGIQNRTAEHQEQLDKLKKIQQSIKKSQPRGLPASR